MKAKEEMMSYRGVEGRALDAPTASDLAAADVAFPLWDVEGRTVREGCG